MKKLFSLALALIMIFALATTAMAATISVDPLVPDATEGSSAGTEVYTAYKIFTATFDGDSAEGKNVSYTIDSGSDFYSVIDTYTYEGVDIFDLTQVNETTTYIVKQLEDYDAADLASKLKAAIVDEVPAATANAAQADGLYDLTGITKGYYMITSSLGSKILVETFGGDITVETKNEYPTLDKTIVGGVNDGKSIDAQYGETITFEIKVKVPDTVHDDIIVHDKLDEDMTYGELKDCAGVSKLDTCEVANCDGNLHFTIDYDAVTKDANGYVTFEYTATLNAGVLTATPHTNNAWLTYSSYTSVPAEVKVYTYQVDVFKHTSDGNGLAGAGFVVKNSADKYYAIDANGYVTWVDNIEDATEMVTDAADDYTVTFAGLANGEYVLIEKTVPTGYNPAQDYDFEIENANLSGNTKISVLNETGIELPSTGGVGTTIFTVVGALLMGAAFILFITKKKMANEQ